MALRTQLLLVLCLTAVAANFVTEREWLKNNPGKKAKDYEDLLQAFQKKLANERAEDYEDEVFSKADLDGDGKHSKDEMMTELMTSAGFELDNKGKYVPAAAKDMFVQIDTNKDGKVQLEEYLAHFKNHTEKDFKKNDSDGDGVHTYEEQMAFTGEHTKETYKSSEEAVKFYLKHGDTNADGKLTKEEKRVCLKHYSARMEFDDMDDNQDGKHSFDELVEADMRKHHYVRDQAGGFFEEHMYNQYHDEFERLDVNKDEKVSKEEFLKGNPGSKEADFQKHDFNNDGQHTLDELLSKQSGATNSALKDATKFAEDSMKDADKDKDGFVSWDEFRQHVIPDDEL